MASVLNTLKSIILLFVLGIATTSAEPYTIAVLRFENNSLMGKQTYDGLKKGLCDIW